MTKKKDNFRKGFRKNKRIKHPAYVVDKDGNLYKYVGVTHSRVTGAEENIPLISNPNPNDSRQAYIRPYVEKDEPKNFGRRYDNWNFSKSDKTTVNKVIEKSKKKPRK